MTSKKEVEADPRFAATKFIVEADSYAYHSLWKENQREHDPHVAMSWEQDSLGKTVTAGKFHREEVQLTFFWYYLDGHPVAFWNSYSTVFHRGIAEKWLVMAFGDYDVRKKKPGILRENADNFHRIIHGIKDLGHSGRKAYGPVYRSIYAPKGLGNPIHH